MNSEEDEFQRIEAEAKRRAMAEEDDDTQTYTNESAEAYAYRCGYEAGVVAAAIKEALAQPEKKAVAWGVFEGNLHDMFFTQSEAQEMAKLKGTHAEVRPLYTAPPQRPWQGLTDDEVTKIIEMGLGVRDSIKTTIDQLKERNNG